MAAGEGRWLLEGDNTCWRGIIGDGEGQYLLKRESGCLRGKVTDRKGVWFAGDRQ